MSKLAEKTSIRCSIITNSHRLNEAAFTILAHRDSPFHIKDLNTHTFSLVCPYKPDRHKDLEHFAISTHLAYASFIMSLNIATIGYFNWELNLSPQYTLENIEKWKPLGSITFHNKSKFPADLVDITPDDIRKAILLFGVLCNENESVVVQEYLRGILHLSLNFTFINFTKEAFGNFYRAFENVATERILKVSKLKNELKELQEALRMVGVDKDIIAEFKILYRLRSSQIMHAQNKQISVSSDDVFKMKVILDFVLHNIYKPIWTERMNKIHEASSH